MTVREWFRKMRAEDFRRNSARFLATQAKVDEVTAETYPVHAWSVHAAWGCTCRTCSRWRQGIYDAGLMPRPRQYNGERG